MKQEFYKFLDNEINLSELEEMIYIDTMLENDIGLDNYQYLLEFNYKKKHADIEIQEFILRNIINMTGFGLWKANKIIELDKLNFPTENLFAYAKQNPNFLKGKKTKFKQFRTEKKIEIFWTDKIYQFVRHVWEMSKDKENYLYLGTYEDSYIHLVVNKENEIWLAYDIINKEEYWAKNIEEAIMKLYYNSEEIIEHNTVYN